MDLTSIKAIKEFTSTDMDNIDVAVNSYLNEGWIMLYCGTEQTLNDTQCARIILGTDKERS